MSCILVMVEKSTLKKLIGYGIKAPSGHNTQPWQFKIGDSQIQIHPDFSRSLPIVDSDNHALYISLGCAAENILIASTCEKLKGDLQIIKNRDDIVFIQINLTPEDSIIPDDLFRFIYERQTTRKKYDDKKVALEELEKLRNSFDFSEIELMFFSEKNKVEALKPFIIEASNRQFNNKDFVNELIRWVRFSKTDASKKKDGLWVSCMGIPNIGRLIGNFMIKKVVSAKSEARRWQELINASAGMVLFVANGNTVHHWVTLGRAFQRFGLTATKLNINHAHVNMPCEEIELRKKLVEHLNLNGKHPLLLLRYGYSDRMPYSFRREIREVLVK